MNLAALMPKFAVGLRGLAVIAAMLALTPSVSNACSMDIPRYKGFDPLEYVFYGRVIDYVSRDLRDGTKAWGLKLEIVDPLHTPTTGTRMVEVFRFFIDSPACHTSGISEASAREVPLGTEYEVAAKPFSDSSSDRVQLDVSAYSGAVLNAIPRGIDIATRHKFEADWSQIPPQDFSKNGGYSPKFEIRKDVIRLENAPSPDEAKTVLVRLMRLPIVEVLEDIVGFPRLVRRYVTDGDDLHNLVESYRQAWRLPADMDLYEVGASPGDGA